MPQGIETGAHDLRLAAYGVGILHLGTPEVRRAYLAVGEQGSIHGGDAFLTALAACRVNARIEWHVARLEGIDRQRSGDDRRGERVLGGEQTMQRERGRDLCSVEEGKSLLGLEREGRETDGAQAIGSRHLDTADA